MENERDCLGVIGTFASLKLGEPGDGLLLRLPPGLIPGVCRMVVLRFRTGSGSRLGIPVALVVVVHVLVDMRRRRLSGKLRRKR